MRASPGVDAADKLLHWVTEALLQVPIFARLRDEDAELPQRFASAAVAGGALAPPCAPAAKPRDWLSPWRDGSMLIVAEGAVEVMDCRTGRVLGVEKEGGIINEMGVLVEGGDVGTSTAEDSDCDIRSEDILDEPLPAVLAVRGAGITSLQHGGDSTPMLRRGSVLAGNALATVETTGGKDKGRVRAKLLIVSRETAEAALSSGKRAEAIKAILRSYQKEQTWLVRKIVRFPAFRAAAKARAAADRSRRMGQCHEISSNSRAGQDAVAATAAVADAVGVVNSHCVSRLARLCGAGPQHFDPGTAVCRSGRKALHMYLLREGRLVVVDQRGRIVNWIRPGSSVGEIGVISAARRTMNIIVPHADDPTTLSTDDEVDNFDLCKGASMFVIPRRGLLELLSGRGSQREARAFRDAAHGMVQADTRRDAKDPEIVVLNSDAVRDAKRAALLRQHKRALNVGEEPNNDFAEADRDAKAKGAVFVCSSLSAQDAAVAMEETCNNADLGTQIAGQGLSAALNTATLPPWALGKAVSADQIMARLRRRRAVRDAARADNERHQLLRNLMPTPQTDTSRLWADSPSLAAAVRPLDAAQLSPKLTGVSMLKCAAVRGKGSIPFDVGKARGFRNGPDQALRPSTAPDPAAVTNARAEERSNQSCFEQFQKNGPKARPVTSRATVKRRRAERRRRRELQRSRASSSARMMYDNGDAADSATGTNTIGVQSYVAQLLWGRVREAFMHVLRTGGYAQLKHHLAAACAPPRRVRMLRTIKRLSKAPNKTGAPGGRSVYGGSCVQLVSDGGVPVAEKFQESVTSVNVTTTPAEFRCRLVVVGCNDLVDDTSLATCLARAWQGRLVPPCGALAEAERAIRRRKINADQGNDVSVSVRKAAWLHLQEQSRTNRDLLLEEALILVGRADIRKAAAHGSEHRQYKDEYGDSTADEDGDDGPGALCAVDHIARTVPARQARCRALAPGGGSCVSFTAIENAAIRGAYNVGKDKSVGTEAQTDDSDDSNRGMCEGACLVECSSSAALRFAAISTLWDDASAAVACAEKAAAVAAIATYAAQAAATSAVIAAAAAHSILLNKLTGKAQLQAQVQVQSCSSEESPLERTIVNTPQATETAKAAIHLQECRIGKALAAGAKAGNFAILFRAERGIACTEAAIRLAEAAVSAQEPSENVWGAQAPSKEVTTTTALKLVIGKAALVAAAAAAAAHVSQEAARMAVQKARDIPISEVIVATSAAIAGAAAARAMVADIDEYSEDYSDCEQEAPSTKMVRQQCAVAAAAAAAIVRRFHPAHAFDDAMMAKAAANAASSAARAARASPDCQRMFARSAQAASNLISLCPVYVFSRMGSMGSSSTTVTKTQDEYDFEQKNLWSVVQRRANIIHYGKTASKDEQKQKYVERIIAAAQWRAAVAQSMGEKRADICIVKPPTWAGHDNDIGSGCSSMAMVCTHAGTQRAKMAQAAAKNVDIERKSASSSGGDGLGLYDRRATFRRAEAAVRAVGECIQERTTLANKADIDRRRLHSLHIINAETKSKRRHSNRPSRTISSQRRASVYAAQQLDAECTFRPATAYAKQVDRLRGQRVDHDSESFLQRVDAGIALKLEKRIQMEARENAAVRAAASARAAGVCTSAHAAAAAMQSQFSLGAPPRITCTSGRGAKWTQRLENHAKKERLKRIGDHNTTAAAARERANVAQQLAKTVATTEYLKTRGNIFGESTDVGLGGKEGFLARVQCDLKARRRNAMLRATVSARAAIDGGDAELTFAPNLEQFRRKPQERRVAVLEAAFARHIRNVETQKKKNQSSARTSDVRKLPLSAVRAIVHDANAAISPRDAAYRLNRAQLDELLWEADADGSGMVTQQRFNGIVAKLFAKSEPDTLGRSLSDDGSDEDAVARDIVANGSSNFGTNDSNAVVDDLQLVWVRNWNVKATACPNI